MIKHRQKSSRFQSFKSCQFVLKVLSIYLKKRKYFFTGWEKLWQGHFSAIPIVDTVK